MALAYPGQFGEMYETIARDAFLESLADSSLRITVLDQQPKTLDEALTVVTRMQAYSDCCNDNDDDDASRKHVRLLASSQARNSDSDRIKMLEQKVLEQDREIGRLRTAANHAATTCVETKGLAPPVAGSCMTSDNFAAWQPAGGGYQAAAASFQAGVDINNVGGCDKVTFSPGHVSHAGFVPTEHVHPGLSGAASPPQPQTGRGPSLYGGYSTVP